MKFCQLGPRPTDVHVKNQSRKCFYGQLSMQVRIWSIQFVLSIKMYVCFEGCNFVCPSQFGHRNLTRHCYKSVFKRTPFRLIFFTYRIFRTSPNK